MNKYKNFRGIPNDVTVVYFGLGNFNKNDKKWPVLGGFQSTTI